MTSTASDDQFLPHQDDVDQAQPKRRPYNASASLSEYGIFPECDAAQAPAKGAGDECLTAKQAWWAGYRAGKGLPPDTPRQDALAATVRCFKCGEQANVSISSAKLVTRLPGGTPRDERDIASDPDGKLIHDPSEPLFADRQQRGGDVIDVEAAAKKLAECMDYPWAEMTEQGRKRMREHAQAVVSAAQAATKGESNE